MGFVPIALRTSARSVPMSLWVYLTQRSPHQGHGTPKVLRAKPTPPPSGVAPCACSQVQWQEQVWQMDYYEKTDQDL